MRRYRLTHEPWDASGFTWYCESCGHHVHSADVRTIRERGEEIGGWGYSSCHAGCGSEAFECPPTFYALRKGWMRRPHANPVQERGAA